MAAEIKFTGMNAAELASALTALSKDEDVWLLDSCGRDDLGSRFLIAGIRPISTKEFFFETRQEAMAVLDTILQNDKVSIFTLSYDLGMLLAGVDSRHPRTAAPDLLIADFDTIIIHDQLTGRSSVEGRKATEIAAAISNVHIADKSIVSKEIIDFRSDISRSEYVANVEKIHEQIRDGWTYQTNLTRSLSADLPDDLNAGEIFLRFREQSPAPFASFISRPDQTVISASPERFFLLTQDKITASPIKGTRPRGSDPSEDRALRQELMDSQKDRAENAMIVDLLRNDLGRVCDFGTINVSSPFEIVKHSTLFHMVSTINGRLKERVVFSDILSSLFPCGSITGAPKLSTMKIIDDLESSRRGLSMGAIGINVPVSFSIGQFTDLSVAIRTMTIHNGKAEFRVGGGIVIDSDPLNEWNETVTKSKAILNAMNGVEV